MACAPKVIKVDLDVDAAPAMRSLARLGAIAARFERYLEAHAAAYPEPAWADEQWSRAESWRSIPEPVELTEWAEEATAAKTAKEAADNVPCANCGKRRGHADHQFVASRLTTRCQYQPPKDIA